MHSRTRFPVRSAGGPGPVWPCPHTWRCCAPATAGIVRPSPDPGPGRPPAGCRSGRLRRGSPGSPPWRRRRRAADHRTTSRDVRASRPRTRVPGGLAYGQVRHGRGHRITGQQPRERYLAPRPPQLRERHRPPPQPAEAPRSGVPGGVVGRNGTAEPVRMKCPRYVYCSMMGNYQRRLKRVNLAIQRVGRADGRTG